ncbi:MAG: PAS domain-containing protein [Pseudanabaena sp. M090S1SP2A07QC]|jgi:hypothetical protein|nr:PAS domain-containing protein [Pseudanabaena sp. M090S1SP2A07QC]
MKSNNGKIVPLMPRHLFQGQAITLLGDDLYSRQPMCQHCLDAEMNFIFTCLPSSHSSLYEWLDYLEKNGEVQQLTTKHRKGKSIEIYTYRFVNQIPLREQEPSLLVNWCELTVRDSADNSEVFHNAFVTNHAIDIDNVAEIVEAGKCRWKTENENHNVLRHFQSHGKVPFYNEVRYRHKGGSTVWGNCSGKVIEWDQEGKPLRMIGCHIDIR